MLPKSTHKKLQSTMVIFWWGQKEGRRPIYWKKNPLLEDHKNRGGLGIQNIESLNHALLFKQAWRISTNHELLVSRVFNGKSNQSWFKKSMEGDTKRRSVSWGARSIMRSVSPLKAEIRRIIGNGKSTSILHDVWVGESKISFKLPNQPDGSANPSLVAELINEEKREWIASSVWILFHARTARDILATNIG